MTFGNDVIEFPAHSQPDLLIARPEIQHFGESFEDSDGNVFRIEKVHSPWCGVWLLETNFFEGQDVSTFCH